MGYNPISNDVGNQISNPGVTPSSPSSPVGPGKPGVGAGEEVEGRPFSLGPAEGKGTPEASPDLPSPMQVAGDAARQQPQHQIEPPELSDHLERLQNQLNTMQQKLQNPGFGDTLTDDHQNALQRLTQKMNPDMQTIAKYTKGEFQPAQQGKGQSALEYVSNWINGSQSTLQGALTFLQSDQKPNPADYLRLQYAVQRATQRGELFASIVGSTVSGVKTILSTQLG